MEFNAFYSKKLNKFYLDEAELVKDEEAYDKKQAEIQAAEEAKRKEAEAKQHFENALDTAYEQIEAAKKHYYDLLNEYNEKYGVYHTKSVRTTGGKDITSLLDFIMGNH